MSSLALANAPSSVLPHPLQQAIDGFLTKGRFELERRHKIRVQMKRTPYQAGLTGRRECRRWLRFFSESSGSGVNFNSNSNAVHASVNSNSNADLGWFVMDNKTINSRINDVPAIPAGQCTALLNGRVGTCQWDQDCRLEMLFSFDSSSVQIYRQIAYDRETSNIREVVVSVNQGGECEVVGRDLNWRREHTFSWRTR